MDAFKEMMLAFEARLRSKLMGSIILAFIATNWKAIYFVIFEPVSAVKKFAYFDDNTDRWSIVAIPVIAGLLLTLLLPWINAGVMWLTSAAQKIQRDLKNNMQSFNEMSKEVNDLKMQAQRKKAIANIQAAIVQSAKAEEEAKTIQDKETREKVQKELADTKKELTGTKNDIELSNMSYVESKNYGDLTLEEIQKEITKVEKRLDRYERNLRTYQKQNAAFEAEEKSNKITYETALAKAKKINDEKTIQDLKLKRANEISVYKQSQENRANRIQTIHRLEKRSQLQKQRLMAELEKRFDL